MHWRPLPFLLILLAGIALAEAREKDKKDDFTPTTPAELLRKVIKGAAEKTVEDESDEKADDKGKEADKNKASDKALCCPDTRKTRFRRTTLGP